MQHPPLKDTSTASHKEHRRKRTKRTKKKKKKKKTVSPTPSAALRSRFQLLLLVSLAVQKTTYRYVGHERPQRNLA